MSYWQIIASGSSGNATVLHNKILIDCGVPFKLLEPYYRKLSLVLLTHIHSDHFNRSTIARLACERPSLRFGCCEWLCMPLIDCGVSPANIDVYTEDTAYNYGSIMLKAVPLVHNVPNCGYKIRIGDIGKWVFYATDTNNLNGIEAKGYDLYLVEANFEENEIKERIEDKKYHCEYAYEMQVLKNHLSKQKADDWIYKNIKQNGTYIYMHEHRRDKDGYVTFANGHDNP